MRSLSSTVRLMPSNCAPSRSVVSKTSIRSLIDMLDPFLVLVDLAAHGARIVLRDHRGHRPGTRDLAVVHRVHGAHLGGGAAHEHLFGDVEVAARQLADS